MMIKKIFIFICFFNILFCTIDGINLDSNYESKYKKLTQNADNQYYKINNENSNVKDYLKFSMQQKNSVKAKSNANKIYENKIIQDYNNKIKNLDDKLNALDSVWLKRYEAFKNYHILSNEIRQLQEKGRLSTSDDYRLSTLKRQISLLSEYKDRPFGELLEKPVMPDIVTINNPFAIFGGLSYIKHIEQIKHDMIKNQLDLNAVLELIDEKINIYNLVAQNNDISDFQKEHFNVQLAQVLDKSFKLQSAKKILETTMDVFIKNSDENIQKIKYQIKEQILKLTYIIVGILVCIAATFIFKFFIKKYIENHRRAYTASKVINFISIAVILFILIFAYIDNATYAIAFVGFASAGLAIAMKDLFMSILGWLVIISGGSIHVGDRIRVKYGGDVFIGDVIDISILKISIYDDITLTSYRDNHRAGRIIFIPNNHIFTNLISNYSHGGLTNIWDSVEINITFNSNIAKAKEIALDVATKFAKNYTEQTRKQMKKMRDKYSLTKASLNIDPRVFNFIQDNGMQISVWFQNYSFGTLKLKSLIAQDIVTKYNNEDDIFIAYPITRIVFEKHDMQDAKSKKKNNKAQALQKSFEKWAKDSNIFESIMSQYDNDVNKKQEKQEKQEKIEKISPFNEKEIEKLKNPTFESGAKNKNAQIDINQRDNNAI